MGTLITFYSYKGGVGRSMALANTGVVLAQWGYNVLVVDFDLEAPGLENFFQRFLNSPTVRDQRGVVDFLCDYLIDKTDIPPDLWKDDPIPIRLPKTPGRLELWTAGIQDENYFKNVRRLDFPELYSKKNAGLLIESLRTELKKKYDFVLVDSRTGLTDIGGICTIQLPDSIVLVFTTTEQAFQGGLDIIKRASSSRHNIPFERLYVPTIPVPSRMEVLAEFRLSQRWLDRFAEELSDIFSVWLPRDVRARDLLDLIKLPHVSFFSYGESLPVIEQGTNDPGGLGSAYENLAALIARDLQKIELLVNSRDEYIKGAAQDIGKRSLVEHIPRIFISYNHRDEEWLRQLRAHLAPLAQSRELSIWDDTKIHPGSHWRDEISEVISEADVAILLVSPDYLASDFILDGELPLLLKAAQDRGLIILWIPVRHSLYRETELAHFQSAINPEHPISTLTPSARDAAWVSVANRIAEIAGRKY